ncbi:hypothetical protein DL95DRAFT_459354 [Leptodontidium sp. 2 PMI_412]|nr:hypothetical protein DL95DRAFT_459354 [Leptodontidium sp. 2 PMI_412]
MPTMTQLRSFLHNHSIHILIYQVSMFTLLFLYLSFQSPLQHDTHHLTRRTWGSCPSTPHCNGKFKTATLLSLFLGTFGVDQFYAHHWVLAAFKLVTLGGLGTWSLIDVVLWIVGGIYELPGCGGGYGG